MRLATLVDGAVPRVAIVRDDRCLGLDPAEPGFASMRSVAAGGPELLARVASWADAQPPSDWVGLEDVVIGPAVTDPGAIYTIGHNYRSAGQASEEAPERPLVYGKAASSVGAHGTTLTWDRSVSDDVDAEVELGVVVGASAFNVPPERAMQHVFGYTIINDVSARDPWLDGDQWLIGKSLPGFCPVGPWVVTADSLDPDDLALGCRINGETIQDARTSLMRTRIGEILSYLSRHVRLEPGDLIATGTPSRLSTPPGPGRRLRGGDEVTAWIQGIGELTTHIG